ncbi:hypothetical protein KY310_01715 [Candidatus Woesearchaeota archaeon]|nr:hypothetical protein [Candidatus Woesearchaeota archaeon]
MKAKVAAGIIAWSLLLNLPFVCRELYRSYKENKVLEQRIAPVVEQCNSIYPRGLHFVLKNRTEVRFLYDRIASEYIGDYILAANINTDDKMYDMCLKADKNKNRIIELSEAKNLYASLLRQQ